MEMFTKCEGFQEYYRQEYCRLASPCRQNTHYSLFIVIPVQNGRQFRLSPYILVLFHATKDIGSIRAAEALQSKHIT